LLLNSSLLALVNQLILSLRKNIAISLVSLKRIAKELQGHPL